MCATSTIKQLLQKQAREPELARESERVQLVASDSAGECKASERTSMSSADTPPITGTDNGGESDPPAGPTPTELSKGKGGRSQRKSQ